MIEMISENLTGLIKDFIVLARNWKLGRSDEIYDAVDKISLSAQKETYEQIQNGFFEEAAKVYLLISKALMDTHIRHIKDDQLSATLLEAAVSWQNQAERILHEAIIYYTDEAYKYQKEKDHEKSIEFRNKAKNLEYQMKNGSLNKELDKEVSASYLMIRTEAEVEWMRVRARSAYSGLKEGLRRIFKREPSPIEEMIIPTETIAEAKPRISPEKIIIKNDYRPSKIDEDYYEWSIYLVADDDIMNQIESVTYTLHPTFPQPEQIITDPAQGFKLEASGWGEFQIKVDIHLKDAETISKYHWLDLGGRPEK